MIYRMLKAFLDSLIWWWNKRHRYFNSHYWHTRGNYHIWYSWYLEFHTVFSCGECVFQSIAFLFRSTLSEWFFLGSPIFWYRCIAIKVYRKHFVKFLDQNQELMLLNSCKLFPSDIDWTQQALTEFHFRCNIDNKNVAPFQLLFLVGICFLVLATLSSFYLKSIEPKKLVCENGFHSRLEINSIQSLSMNLLLTK